MGTSGDGFVSWRATQSSYSTRSAGVLNCTHRVAGSNSTMFDGFPPGGRCRDDVNVNEACHPCEIDGRYAAVRDARPATGCDAISRAYFSSGDGRVRSVPGTLGGTAWPKMRENTANGLF